MKLKKEIFKACKPPEPRGRDGFLRNLPYPKLTYPEFVLLQIRYIRKRVWLVSAVVLLVGIESVCVIPDSGILLVWIISALIPFLAVLTAAEVSRSDIFGMSEIEAGCRFDLPCVAGARMMILGVCNFAVIAAAAVILGIYSPLGVAKSALYILAPYVSVNGISLAVLGRVKGQDGVYLSASAALAVSLAGVIFSKNFIYEPSASLFMTAVCAAGALLMTVQSRKILTRKDNYYGIKN